MQKRELKIVLGIYVTTLLVVGALAALSPSEMHRRLMTLIINRFR